MSIAEGSADLTPALLTKQQLAKKIQFRPRQMKKVKTAKHTLEKLRMALGDCRGPLKQEEAAKAFGISRSLLASIETGKKRLTSAMADRIASGLYVDPQWLLENKPETPIKWITLAPGVPGTAKWTARLAELSETPEEVITGRGDYTTLDGCLRNDWKEFLSLKQCGAPFMGFDDDNEVLVFFWHVIRLMVVTGRAVNKGDRLPFSFRLGRFLDQAESEYGCDGKLCSKLLSAIYFDREPQTFYLNPLLKAFSKILNLPGSSRRTKRKKKSK